MISDETLVAWLATANRRYSSQGVSHAQRPLKALIELSREHQWSFLSDDPIVKKIHQWFYDHSPPGAHHVGSAYTGIYYYDTAFWPVYIPIILGRVRINGFKCLGTMPAPLKQQIAASEEEFNAYTDHWIDCVDYGYGQTELKPGGTLKDRSIQFLGAAHQELKGANSLLLETRPNVKAILGMRMASEIFLKTVLVQELDMPEDQLRNISHKLDVAARKCAEATGDASFNDIADLTVVYPPVSARYEATDWPKLEVWRAAKLTQMVGATVTRRYSNRNLKAQGSS